MSPCFQSRHCQPVTGLTSMILALLLLVVSGTLSGGCSAPPDPKRPTYAAPNGKLTELATIQLSSQAFVRTIDGKEVTKDSFELDTDNQVLLVTPGPHVITLQGGEIRRGQLVWLARNAMTIAHTFVAGRTYKLNIIQPEFRRTWEPELFDVAQGKVVARVQKGVPFLRPSRQPAAGTGAVTGFAAVPYRRSMLSSVDRPVDLIPRTPAAEKWLNGKMATRENIPRSVTKDRRTVYGFGSGQFEFIDVPPGEYYVFFGVGESVKSVPVTVRTGKVTEKVDCTGELPSSMPNAPKPTSDDADASDDYVL